MLEKFLPQFEILDGIRADGGKLSLKNNSGCVVGKLEERTIRGCSHLGPRRSISQNVLGSS